MYRFACACFAFSIQSNLLIAHGIVLSLFCFVLLYFWLAKNIFRRHVKIHAMLIGISAFFHMIASHIKFQLARMIYLNVYFFFNIRKTIMWIAHRNRHNGNKMKDAPDKKYRYKMRLAEKCQFSIWYSGY